MDTMQENVPIEILVGEIRDIDNNKPVENQKGETTKLKILLGDEDPTRLTKRRP